VIIVSDTSPISNLAVVGYIHLLPKLFGTIIIPDIVYHELLANSIDHPVTQVTQSATWLEIVSVSDRQQAISLERTYNLDPGEAHAIALALELRADQLLIDERLGRREAKRYGLKSIGIMGILLAAKRQAFIPFVRPVMDALIQQANFRVGADLYAEVLQLADE
jgi:uncharacterized protein